jgi:hypothetical protein
MKTLCIATAIAFASSLPPKCGFSVIFFWTIAATSQMILFSSLALDIQG